MKNRKCKRRCN